jgi:LPXTG-motif cell wall-anchored protein
MEEHMTEDFIFEEDESADQSTRRAFLIAVGVLATVGVVSVACIAIILLGRGSNGDLDEIAAIETRNAETLARNEDVTRTLIAMETEAARPTNTPPATPTNTATPVPTNTPRPTDTPVVAQAGEDEATSPSFSGTSAFGTGAAADTPTPIAALGGGTGDGSLPQTGISTWGATIAAFLLIAILIAARRLRSN